MTKLLLMIFGVIITILGLILSFNIFKHYTVIFLIGWLFLMLFLNEKFFSNSNLKIIKNKYFILLLIFLGAIVTLIIEYIGVSISPAWIYSFNFFNFRFDFWFSIGAYIMYIPATYETYCLIKNITKIELKEKINHKKLMNIMLIISIALLILPFIWSNEKYVGLPFCFFVIGLFFLFDFINYKLSKSSIIFNSLNNPKYLLIIIITSLAMSIPSEFTNIIQYVWTYVNIPFIQFTIFKVPIIILIGWIPLVGLWINLFEIIISSLRQKKLSR